MWDLGLSQKVYLERKLLSLGAGETRATECNGVVNDWYAGCGVSYEVPGENDVLGMLVEM
jgi:hypothetical protein